MCPIAHVLVAIDLSSDAREVVDYAAGLARATGALLHAPSGDALI